jgi:hypothetical protein
MKLTYSIVAASAVLAFAPVAMAEEAVQGTSDCASLHAQYDQAASTATVEQVSKAQMARDEGKKLCDEGKSAEGAAKLKEAISQIAAPSQQPSS